MLILTHEELWRNINLLLIPQKKRVADIAKHIIIIIKANEKKVLKDYFGFLNGILRLKRNGSFICIFMRYPAQHTHIHTHLIWQDRLSLSTFRIFKSCLD